MRRINRKRPEFVEISMLNLIDVIFILLIFFMLSTTFSKFWHYDIKLPKAAVEEVAKNDKSIKEIVLSRELELYLKNKDELVKISELDKYLNADDTVLLSADKDVSYDNLIKTISLIKNTNVNQIKLNIER